MMSRNNGIGSDMVEMRDFCFFSWGGGQSQEVDDTWDFGSRLWKEAFRGLGEQARSCFLKT
jgi:hypothetical protein